MQFETPANQFVLTINELEKLAKENSSGNEVSVSFWSVFVEKDDNVFIEPRVYTLNKGKLVNEELGYHIVEMDSVAPFKLDENKGEGPAALLTFHTHPDSIGQENKSFVLPSGQYVEGKELFGDINFLIESKIYSEHINTSLNILSSYGMTLNVGVRFSGEADYDNTKEGKVRFLINEGDNWLEIDRFNEKEDVLKSALSKGYTLVKILQEDPSGEITEYFQLIISWEKIKEIAEQNYLRKDFIKIISFGNGIKKILKILNPNVEFPAESLMSAAMDFKTRRNSTLKNYSSRS